MKKILLLNSIIAVLLLVGCTSGPDTNQILDNFIINKDYKFISIETDFVSGSDCMWHVVITLQNKTTNAIVRLSDFVYDVCEDKLYYGWFSGINLDTKYGTIYNE